MLTAAIVDMEQRTISMAHVGDSRLYGFRHGTLKKLSHDHSLIGYREEIGDLTEEEAMHHPQRNVIGRDVGSRRHKANDEEFIEAQVFPLKPNTILLFCSDGLSDMITSAAITAILSSKKKLEEKADALIAAALEAGGKDNVTVVLVEFVADEPAGTAKEEYGPSRPSNIEKQPVAPKPSSKNTVRRNRSGAIACLFLGLAIGGAAAYFAMNYQMKQFKAGNEKQIEVLNDSIAGFKNTIDSLNNTIDSLKMPDSMRLEPLEPFQELITTDETNYEEVASD